MTMLSMRREVGEFRKHYKWMALVVVITFTILLIRIIYLQLISHDTWSAEAKKNITKRIRLPATRGIIALPTTFSLRRSSSGKTIWRV
jgi:penicillin-binding protein 2